MILALQWDNTINLSDIISVLSLLVIFWTLNEMRNQRHDSNKVEISVKSNQSFRLEENEHGYIDYKDVTIDITNISNNSIYKLDVISYPDFDAIIKNFAEADLNLVHKVESNAGLKLDGFYMEDSLYAKNRIAQLKSDYRFSIDQILSYEKAQFVIPDIYIILYHKLCRLTFGQATNIISAAAMRYPEMPIHLRYENIHKKPQDKYIKIKIVFHMVGTESEDIGFGIKVTEISKKEFSNMTKNKLNNNAF